jgi:hypothetical protein
MRVHRGIPALLLVFRMKLDAPGAQGIVAVQFRRAQLAKLQALSAFLS